MSKIISRIFDIFEAVDKGLDTVDKINKKYTNVSNSIKNTNTSS